MGLKMVHVTADTCVRCGTRGESTDKPTAPPRVTDAETGGAALGPIVLSLLFLACCGTDAGAAASTTGLKTVRLDI